MDKQNQIICAWGGPISIFLFFVGFWPLSGFFPPHLPSASAAEIAAIYQQDTNMIRLGMLVMMTGAAFSVPFVAVISSQMRRIESRSAVLSYTQLGAGMLGVLVLQIPILVFAATTFRPERAPELTQLLNDLGWVLFVMPFSLYMIQCLSIGLAILSDRRPQRVFPRWLAFFNFWVAVLSVPGGMITFFKIGPFAWNGLLGFWIPAIVFGNWYVVMFAALLKTIKSQPESP